MKMNFLKEIFRLKLKYNFKMHTYSFFEGRSVITKDILQYEKLEKDDENEKKKTKLKVTAKQ